MGVPQPRVVSKPVDEVDPLPLPQVDQIREDFFFPLDVGLRVPR